MGKTPHPDWLVSLQSLLTTVVIAVFVITFMVQAFQIPSESMENTLLIGDYLLVDKLRYGGSRFLDRILPYRTVHRGDIVVFHYPVHPSAAFREARGGHSRRPHSPDQPAGLCERRFAERTLRAVQLADA